MVTVITLPIIDLVAVRDVEPTTLTVRVDESSKNLIDNAARTLSLKTSEFMRTVLVGAARNVLEQVGKDAAK